MTEQPEMKTGSAPSCFFYAGGTILMLLVYGLLQERIMTIPYGGELFTASVFLVFCNRMMAVAFALIMIFVKGEPLLSKAPLWKYGAISLSNVAASTCQYEALKWVAFPVQVLGKSFKMMPVMLWGMAISGKRYKTVDWCVAGTVTFGVTQFLLTGSISSARSSSYTVIEAACGLLLLAAFLLFDGFTSTFQEKLFREYTTSKYNQMLYINLGSASVSFLTLILSNTWSYSLAYCSAHPSFVLDVLSLSSAAVAGQWFIYSQVKEFGALVFAATMNLRQVVSILMSYATYGHAVTVMQLLALTIVFYALLYKSYLGLMQTRQSKGEKQPLLAHKADEEAPSSNQNSQAAVLQSSPPMKMPTAQP